MTVEGSTSTGSGAADGGLLADAILGLPSQGLATVLALLEETHLGALVVSRVRDLVSSEGATFQRDLAERAEVLAHEPPAELGLKLFGQLNELLELEPRHYASRKDLEDNAGEIVQRAAEVLRSHDKEFQGRTLRELVEFQTRRMFSQLGKAFEDMPREKQDDFLKAIRDFVQSLPQEQQERIRRELGADELTDETIKRALTSGALGTAFAAAVAVGDFAFYTMATSLLATLAGILGVTLPFGFYTGLTSTIAVLSNPIFLVMVFGGGGIWLYRRQNRTLRQRLVPLIVAQVAVASMASPAGSDSDRAADQAVRLWTEARTRRDRFRQELTSTQIALDQAELELSNAGAKLKAAESDRDSIDGERQSELDAVKELARSSAAAIAEGAWGPGLVGVGIRLRTMLEEAEAADRPQDGWLGRVSGLARRGFDWMTSRREVTRLLDQLAGGVLVSFRSDPTHVDPKVAAILTRVLTLETRVAERSADVERLLEMQAAASHRARECKATVDAANARVDEAASRYPGLARCA